MPHLRSQLRPAIPGRLQAGSVAATGLRRTLVAVGLTVALAPSLARVALPQAIDTTLWVTNGPVDAVAHAGNTIYIGGSFTRVGPATGGGVPLDAASGALPSSFPKVTGIVYAAVSDGAGGWYLGGWFSAVGGIPRSNAAHVVSDMSVSAWNPNANALIDCLAVSGTTVYAGGIFTTIGGQARNNIAALDATSGAATAWNPDADGEVRSLAVSDTTVYACGSFTHIGGQARNYIAALGATSGAASGWNPNADSYLYAIAVHDTLVYAGGSFTDIGGEARNRIAALRATTGTATAWNPNADSNVWGFAVSDSIVYACGPFTNIGGQARNSIAALNPATGAATAWNPNADGEVYTLAVSGSNVYAGGFFANIGGQARNFISSLDVTSGAATLWDPNPNNGVWVVAVSGSTLYAGGEFTSLGGQPRNNVAALDATTGVATGWNPNPDGYVECLAVSGSTVYAGGHFTSIGGQTRNRIAALDATTGVATAWNPNADSTVFAFAVRGSTVYAGGQFSNIGGQARNRVAALDTSGAATAWDPNANAVVQALAVSGSKVYAGGAFTSIGGQTRNRIAALDAAGSATAWDPNANGPVHALAPSGSTLYVGGSFSVIGGEGRVRIAALDTTGGSATTWNPGANNIVRALAISGSTFYAGGDFTVVGGQPRNFIAAVDGTTGAANAWNPNADAVVRALAVGGFKVYAGGDFISMKSEASQCLAAIWAVPDIQAVTPSDGGNAGTVSVTLLGHNLRSGATAKLARSGQPDILGSGVVVAADGSSLSASFDLTAKALGAWDVGVTNPDLQTATLVNGFTITALSAPQLRVDILGPDSIRTSFRTAFDLVVQNPGNVDALNVPLWITGIPLGVTVEPDFPRSPPFQVGGEPDWGTVQDTLTSPGGRYLALVIPRIPPGVLVRRIYLTVPGMPTFTLGAALTAPWADVPAFRNCLVGAGVITNPTCVGPQLTAIRDSMLATPSIQALNGVALWSKVAWQCEGAATLPAALAKARMVLDALVNVVESGTAPVGCGDVFLPRWRTELFVAVVGSIDPNDKLSHNSPFVSSQDRIIYEIRFENEAGAGAPARDVRLVDILASTLDLDVTLGDIIIGSNQPIRPTAGLPYTWSGVLGGVQVSLNVGFTPPAAITRELVWDFRTLDPNPLAGFLAAGEQASVFFSVPPISGIPDGTEILNEATIHMDIDTRTTNPVTNVVDDDPTQSHVLPLISEVSSPTFTVSWVAPSPPLDFKDFTIYVKEDNGDFDVWEEMQNTHETSGTFTPRPGGGGHTYSFYSRARDQSNRQEDEPTDMGGNIVPDAQTHSTTAVGDAGPSQLALAGAQPNPAIGALRVSFTLPSRERASLELIDVAGRRVMKRDVGTLGPGRHHLTLDTPGLKSGLYFLRLAHGGRVLSARVVLMR